MQEQRFYYVTGCSFYNCLSLAFLVYTQKKVVRTVVRLKKKYYVVHNAMSK